MCFLAETGKLLWKGDRHVIGGDGISICIYDEKLYILHHKGLLKCLNSQTGELLWEKKISSSFTTPIAGFGKIFAGRYCVDHVNGNKVWTTKHRVHVKAITDKKVIATGEEKTVCLDINTGELLWESNIRGNLPVIVGEHVWLSDDGGLYCLSLENGKLIFQTEFESRRYYSQIAVSNGRLFVSSCWVGKLHCFEVYDKLIP